MAVGWADLMVLQGVAWRADVTGSGWVETSDEGLVGQLDVQWDWLALPTAYLKVVQMAVSTVVPMAVWSAVGRVG